MLLTKSNIRFISGSVQCLPLLPPLILNKLLSTNEVYLVCIYEILYTISNFHEVDFWWIFGGFFAWNVETVFWSQHKNSIEFFVEISVK